jgi:AcrR family transcriptional regulator
MASDRQADAETRIRSATAQLLSGDIPDGLKCDVKSLCARAGVPRATLYRRYPHLKAEFDRQRDATQRNGPQPDCRLVRIERLKSEIIDLRARLASRNGEISELKRFRDTALSRLAAQHEEITALRTQLRAANQGKSARCRADSNAGDAHSRRSGVIRAWGVLPAAVFGVGPVQAGHRPDPPRRVRSEHDGRRGHLRAMDDTGHRRVPPCP